MPGAQGHAGSSRADLGGRAPPAPGGRQEGGSSLEALAPRVQKVIGRLCGLEVLGGTHRRAWLRGPKALPCQALWLLWGQPTSGAGAGGVPPSLGLRTGPRQSSFSSPETWYQSGSAGPGALSRGDGPGLSQTSSVGHVPPTQLPQERPRQGKKDGKGSAGGRRFTDGGTQVPGPGAGPGRPPRGEPAPSLQWEDGETWTRCFCSQAPQGIAAPGCRPEAPRDTAWPEVAPGGSVRPASATSRLCKLLAGSCPVHNRGSVGLVCGGCRPGRARRLQGPLGLSGAPPPLGCSLLLCHGVPTSGCNCQRQGRSCQKGAGGPSVAAPQHLLDGVRGPGTLNAARGHEQPSPKVACPSDALRPGGQTGQAAPSPHAGTFGLPVPAAGGHHCPHAPGPPAGGAWGGRRVDLAQGTLPGSTVECGGEAGAVGRGLSGRGARTVPPTQGLPGSRAARGSVAGKPGRWGEA